MLEENTATAIELRTGRVPKTVDTGRTRGVRFRSGPSGTPTRRLSSAAKVPREVIEMVIAHLIGNTGDLVACSLISHSWYAVAFPHRHDTLVTSTHYWGKNRRFTWPEPLLQMGELGFLPFVKKFQIHRSHNHHLQGISPELSNPRILRHFSALSNVQELGMEDLDIPSFMPGIRLYFGHFMPTVHSLALKKPKGSCRQIVYFIGLFEHLEDLNLLCRVTDPPGADPEDGQTLTPPPLGGRLTLMHSTRAGLLKEMIDLFGRIRFRSMNLFDVQGVRHLLNTCAETLETLQIYPTPMVKRFLQIVCNR